MRTCTRCNEQKPSTEFYYRVDGKPRGNHCKRCVIAQTGAYQSANRERATEWQRRWKLIHTYSITADEFDTLLAKQGGRCAICRTHPRQDSRIKRLALDHDHETGQVRGLLCNRCNRGIGLLGDTAASIDVAIAYLEAASEVA